MASDSHGYLYEFNGETHTLGVWGERLGLDRRLLYQRIETLGWSVEKAFTTPVLPRDRRARRRMLTLDGQTHCLSEWAAIYGLPRDLLASRLDGGWDLREALTTPPRQRRATSPTLGRQYECGGESRTIQEWSEHLGVNKFTLYSRLKSGWPVDRVFSEPSIPAAERRKGRKKREG